jgi:hypothetical protein
MPKAEPKSKPLTSAEIRQVRALLALFAPERRRAPRTLAGDLCRVIDDVLTRAGRP